MRPILLLVRNAVFAFLALCQAFTRALVRAKPVEWVAYELNGSIDRGSPEAPSSLPWRLPRRQRVATYFDFERELDLMRAAPGIRGVLIKLRELHCTPALMRDLRALLGRFRDSGKEVVFHSDHLDTRLYWLASVGTRVWLMPRGRLDLLGFASASSAAARPLRRLGVVFDVIRAGVFKSAGELFGADHVSPEQQHQVGELLGDLNELFLADVAPDRKLTREALQAAVDAGPYSAAGAKAAGLVDDLLYGDELRARLGDKSVRARVGPFAAVLATYAPTMVGRRLRDRRPHIAVVDIEGIIAPGKSRAVPGFGATAGSESLVRTLAELRFDDSIKAVVLRIDSRGGSALASDLIWRAAQRLAEQKPVVAYLDTVAASGGYYIAVAAKQIWAAPTCITGSIGVFMLRPNVTGSLAKLEIDRVTVQRGAHAAIYQPDHALTDDERARLQQDVLETYGDFVQTVATGRGMPETRIRELAEGRVYLATRARQVGLVDKLGTLEDAIDAARAQAGITGAVRVTRVRSQQSDWRQVLRLLRRNATEELIRGVMPRLDSIQAIWLGPELP